MRTDSFHNVEITARIHGKEWHGPARPDRRAPGRRQPPPLRRRGGAARLRASTRTRSGRAPARSSHDLAPAQPRAARPPRRAPGHDRRLAPRAPRRAPTRRPTPRSCARSATCSTSPPRSTVTHRRRRRRGGPDRRPAAGRPAAQRPLRHQRRQRPLGLALRRALRHRRGPRRTATSRPATSYNKVRGDEVIARGRALLDEHFPLAAGSHADATSYAVDGEGLAVDRQGRRRPPRRPRPSSSATGARPTQPEAVLLVHHGLHVEIQVDRDDAIGSTDAAGVKDLLLESAVSTIMDLEDSVAAVDAEDKVLGYRNWLQPDGGHAGRGGHQGRQDLHPRDEPRPHLHRALRRGGHAAAAARCCSSARSAT